MLWTNGTPVTAKDFEFAWKRNLDPPLLHYLGWQDIHHDQLFEESARITDRAKRMAMYRKADHYLVADQSLVLPFSYNLGVWILLTKPWMKNFHIYLLGQVTLQNLIIEDYLSHLLVGFQHLFKPEVILFYQVFAETKGQEIR